MKKVRGAVLLIVSLLLLLTSCLAGAQDSAAPSGVREGIRYLFLEKESLLILSGEGVLPADSRVLSMDFAPQVRYLYLAKGIVGFEENAFARLENLEKVYMYETFEEQTEVELQSGVLDFEESALLPSRTVLGHCPEETSGKCLLCGEDCVYEYTDLYVSLFVGGKKVQDAQIVTEGEKRFFDAEGRLVCEGFSTVGGYTRYFRENRMVTGNADIDGWRCSFSSSGALTSRRMQDKSFSPALLLPTLCALPVGVAVAWGVYGFYKKKSSQAEGALE